MKLIKYKLNNRGINLIYLMMGLAIMSGVGLSAGYVIGNFKKLEVSSSIMATLNQVHILQLQKAKNVDFVRKVLIAAGYDMTKDSGFYNCLADVGSNCTANKTDYKPVTTLQHESISTEGSKVISTGEYKINCLTPTSCNSIAIRIKSRIQSANASPFADAFRESEYRIAGVFLVDRAQLSFNCTLNGSIPTGIDLKSLKAICDVPQKQVVNCINSAPMIQYVLTSMSGSCATTAKIDCTSNGIATIGALSGQGNCASP